MSLLPPEVGTALTQLLQTLSSADNNVRAQAEDQLNNEWVGGRPAMLLMGLVEQIQAPSEASVREQCPVQVALCWELTRCSETDSILRSRAIQTDGDEDTQGPGFGRLQGALFDSWSGRKGCYPFETVAVPGW